MSSNLKDAIIDNDREAIQYILDDPINRIEHSYAVNHDTNGQEDSWSLLHIACDANSTEAVDELLRRGADPNILNDNSQTPLHLAIVGWMDEDPNYEETVDRVLQHPKVDISRSDASGETLLGFVLGATRSYTNIAKKLIQHGAKLTDLDKNHSTALHLACKNFGYHNNYQLLDEILTDKEIDINQTDDQGQTAFHLACHSCSEDEELTKLLDWLIANGAKMNVQDNSGATALHKLCQKQRHNTNKNLALSPIGIFLKLDPGCINCKDEKGLTAIQEAVENSVYKYATELLDYKGIETTVQLPQGTTTVLHRACAQTGRDLFNRHRVRSNNDHFQFIQKLLEKKPKLLNAKDSWGRTPLHIASAAVTFSTWGQRTFDAAAEAAKWRVVQFFLDQDGIETQALDHQGLTPLMGAAAERYASLDFLFRMLCHTGGTVLEIPPRVREERNHQEDDSKKRSHSVAFE